MAERHAQQKAHHKTQHKLVSILRCTTLRPVGRSVALEQSNGSVPSRSFFAGVASAGARRFCSREQAQAQAPRGLIPRIRMVVMGLDGS
jgi:hypothetical protein